MYKRTDLFCPNTQEHVCKRTEAVGPTPPSLPRMVSSSSYDFTGLLRSHDQTSLLPPSPTVSVQLFCHAGNHYLILRDHGGQGHFVDFGGAEEIWSPHPWNLGQITTPPPNPLKGPVIKTSTSCFKTWVFCWTDC